MKNQILKFLLLFVFLNSPIFVQAQATYPLPFAEQAKLMAGQFETMRTAKEQGLLKNCDFWILASSGDFICGKYGSEIALLENDKSAQKCKITSSACKDLDTIKFLQNSVKKLAIDNVDFDKNANSKETKFIVCARDDFNIPRLACAFDEAPLKDFFETLANAVKTDDFSAILKTPIESNHSQNLDKFLAETFGVKEKIDFAAMFEEIKTYGKQNGLCSQLSQVLYDEKKCVELYKFGTNEIHSCDGFYMAKGDFVIFCPSTKDFKFFLSQKEKIAPLFLTQDFAVLPKEIFFKYHTSHPVGLTLAH